MKKRLIATIASCLFISTSLLPAVTANAEPTSVEEARSQYEELKNKVLDINEQVEKLDNEISNLVTEMEDNKAKIDDLNDEIADTNDQIEVVKADISDKEEVLGKRLREVYKSGGQTAGIISLIFSSQNVSDLITRIDSASRVVSVDKKMVNEVVSQKEELDNQISELQSKQDEIVELNNQISEKADEKSSKKQEQEGLLAQAKQDQEEFDKVYLSEEERKIVAGPIGICNNSNSTVAELDNAIAQLESLKANQIKSPTVVSEIDSAVSAGKNLRQTKAAAEAAAKAAAAQQSSSNSSSSNVTPSRGDTSSVGVTGNGSVQAILNEAYKHLGKPYVYGATGPNSFDCSGFTSYVYRLAAGIDIGRTTYSQINAGREVSRSELQPGDLVFPHADHVMIYIGNGMVIHAPHTGDVVKVAPMYGFWRARRILN